MRILLAPTAFKGSFSPASVALAMASGIEDFVRKSNLHVEVDLLPIADGGDGTVESLSLSCPGILHEVAVRGACGKLQFAHWLRLGSTAVVELASACGIAALSTDELRPLNASTHGLGQVIRQVLLDDSVNDIVVALGGSASTDGGSGALSELGVKFFDENGLEVLPCGGADLTFVRSCDLSKVKQVLKGRSIRVATDVENPLLGPNGASFIFAPQKGATKEDIIVLEDSLLNFANVLEQNGNANFRYVKGAGAAGGAAFGLAVALDAEIISGFDWLSRLVNLSEKVQQADLVVTGEGRFDSSSLSGKVVGSLSELCLKFDKPLWIIAASVAQEIEKLVLKSTMLIGLAAPGQIAGANEISQAICKTLTNEYKI